MSSTDFANLRKRYPELSHAFAKLEGYLAAHPGIDHIEPRRVLESSDELDAWALAAAFTVLVRKGKLKRLFAVVAPNRSLAPGFFKSRGEIPNVLYDMRDEPFSRESGDLITVYRDQS